jgi:hypothetical protein
MFFSIEQRDGTERTINRCINKLNDNLVDAENKEASEFSPDERRWSKSRQELQVIIFAVKLVRLKNSVANWPNKVLLKWEHFDEMLAGAKIALPCYLHQFRIIAMAKSSVAILVKGVSASTFVSDCGGPERINAFFAEVLGTATDHFLGEAKDFESCNFALQPVDQLLNLTWIDNALKEKLALFVVLVSPDSSMLDTYASEVGVTVKDFFNRSLHFFLHDVSSALILCSQHSP